MTEAPKLAIVYATKAGRELTPEEVSKLPGPERQAAAYNGARNQGIKEGRQRATAEIMQKLGVQRVEDAGQIAQLTAERDARVSIDEEQKHGRFRFWQGVAMGGAIIGSLVGIGAMWITNSVIDGAFDAAGRIRAQSDMTDALVRSQQEPERNESYTNPGQDVTRRP